MKPYLFVTFLLTLLLKETAAQQNDQIKRQAREFSEAIVKHDYNRWISLMYPKELVIRGGRDSFINVQKRIEKGGIGIITKIIVGDQGKIVQQGNRLFCMLKDTAYLTGGFDIKAYYTLMAVSEDNGKRWYFIDTDWALRILFPDIEKKMPITTKIISSSRTKSKS